MTGSRPRDFDQKVVAVALLVRLVTIAVALVGMLGEVITPTVLACVLVLSATSFSYLVSSSVTQFVMRHPLAVVLDLLVALGVVAALGIESPLVLTTLSTALVMGVLFRAPVVVLGTIALVSGYLIVAATKGLDHGFMVLLGIPAMYVSLAAIGYVVQRAHQREVATTLELVELHRAVSAAEERGRLAREMHDSLGKTLHGIGLAAQALPTWVETDPEAAVRYAREIAAGADQAATEARALLVRLRADQPDRPLSTVLADRCAAWQERSGVTCTFAGAGAVDLSTDARYETLAILDEALENVFRHAHARTVEVTMRGSSDGTVTFAVRDDGAGFTIGADGRPARTRHGHFGVAGMHERAASIGARLELESAHGHGTTVTVHVPTAREDADVRAPR
jgi:signal transduction histidine kinase